MSIPSGRGRLGYIKGSESLPSGAVRMTAEEVLAIQSNAIKKWQPQKEMFFLKYGDQILGGVASLSGMYFVSHFRKALLLKNKAKVATLGTALFIPFLTSFTFHSFTVTKDVRLMKTSCPACFEIRSTSIQLLCGVVFSYLISLTSCVSAAKTFTTFPIPQYSDYKNQIKLISRLSRPISTGLGGFCVLNTIAAVYVTYRQFEGAIMVNKMIMADNVFHS